MWPRERSVVVFDLDDTLYAEEDYLLSAYRTIADDLVAEGHHDLYEVMCAYYREGLSTFDLLREKHEIGWDIPQLLERYRYHSPRIELAEGVEATIDYCKIKCAGLAILTDGRSQTQRNKLSSLGILDKFDLIVISEEVGKEKPNTLGFELIMKELRATTYYYIGDNYAKDFIAPNQLGWITIGLKDAGRNIHPQQVNPCSTANPQHQVQNFRDLLSLNV